MRFKKVLSLIVFTILVMPIVTNTVAHAATVENDISYNSANCNGNHNDWTGISELDWSLPSGRYYLTSDVSVGELLYLFNGDIEICLNGHTITGNIRSMNGKFTLYDCKESGCIHGGLETGSFIMNGGIISCDGTGVTSSYDFVMNGGSILNCYYSGVTVKYGKFEMNGGVISGSKDRSGVYLENTECEFIMNGGVISNNSTTYVETIYGGGVYVGDGTFTMNGGVISNNNTGHTGLGGGVYVDHGLFTMNGGIIRDNVAWYGGGVYLYDGATFVMNGGTIQSNIATYGHGVNGGSGSSVYIGCNSSLSNPNTSVFIMNGGTISSDIETGTNFNICSIGLGLFVLNGNVEIKDNTVGAVTIIGNDFTADTPISVYKFELDDSVCKSVDIATFAEGVTPYDASDKFVSAVDGWVSIYEDSKIKLVRRTDEPSVSNNLTYRFKSNFTSNKSSAIIPDVQFKFDISPADISDLTGDVKQGIGEPIIGIAEFTSEDTFNEPVYVTIDFTNVNFTSAGTYRYKITENEITSTDGITNNNDVRFLDVYVENTNDDDLKIAHYIMNTSTGEDSEKSEGFENEYTVFDLSLTKMVTGSAGDKLKDFTFTISFDESTIKGAHIAISDGIILENGVYVVNLRHNDIITFTGIPKGAKYTISESNNSGYETIVNVLGDLNNNTNNNTFSDEVDGITEDTSITFINNREGVLPTGITLNIAIPVFICIIIIVGLVILVIVKKKDNYSDNDD